MPFDITLNSLHRVSGTDSDAVFELPQRSIGAKGGRVYINTVVIPITMYDLPTGHNTLVFQEIGGETTTTLTTTLAVGNYDGYSLAAELADAMDAISLSGGAAANYTAAYDESTMKLTITSDGPNFLFTSACSAKVQRLLGAYTSTAGALTFAPGSAGTSWTSSSCIQVNPTALYLFSNLAPTSFVAGRGNQNIACVIPISVPQGGLQSYEPRTEYDFNNYPSTGRFWLERDDIPRERVELNGHQCTFYIQFNEVDENS